MDGEITNDFEKLIQVLGDRIEEIERTLLDDEDFCNKDIDATYQAALKYIESFEAKFREKVNELKDKLDQTREKNINISKQNKQQFDDEIEEINQLFSSGKHQEALEKFHDYENRFEQRITIIQNIPKLYMNDIDINRYFSIDKPIDTPPIPSNLNKQNSLENIKPTKTDPVKKENVGINEPKSNKPSFDIRTKHLDNQQTSTNNNPIDKEIKSPLSTGTSRSLNFSTRLTPSPGRKSLPTGEHDIIIPTLVQSNNQSSRENITSHKQVRSTPTSPNIIPPILRRQMSVTVTSKKEGLTQTYVAPYQHERNTSLLMTCNKNYIILFRSQSDRLFRWCSYTLERSNLTERELKWDNLLIKSIGFIDKNNIYIFTEREFMIYTSDLLSKLGSYKLLNDNNYNSEHNDIQRGFGGTVYNKYVYHVYLNVKYHWILSVYELEAINHVCDQDLTENFPDVKRFIHICIIDKTINFLVQMESSQYAVMFCSNNIHSKIELKRLIQLSYAENPSIICPIYIHYIQKYIFFINDPRAKIIHMLTTERYLQSYSVTAYSLCYGEENQELILPTNNGIYSININEQQNFFSKFH